MRHSRLLAAAILLSTVAAFTPANAQEAKRTERVNLFVGTANDFGQMTPGACMPYSQIQVCPDSKPRQHPGYDYEVTTISGFSINRLSGVGGGGCGGNVSLMPDDTGEDVRLVKATEEATPGHYAVQLSNGVWVTATANRRMAVERFSFPENRTPVLLLNPASAFDAVHEARFDQLTPTMGQGYFCGANTCGRGRYHLHYRLYCSEAFRTEKTDDGRMRLTFPSMSGRWVEVRIVVSTGLADELGKIDERSVWRQDLLTIRQRAENEWAQLLETIDVEGGTAQQQTLFYTSLYRTFHSPFQVTDRRLRHYLGTDGKAHEAPRNGQYYSSWSLWDTYRTKFPLITLLDARRSTDIMQSLAQLYITGKKDWSTTQECVPTVRTEHAVATLLDAYRQQISIPNLREAYPHMVAEVWQQPMRSPDQCLETSGDFWALGQLAGELNLPDDAARWTKRGEEIFDSIWPQAFQHIDDTYTKMRGNGLYQGTRWQYRWGAPMYLSRMIERVGKKQLGEELQQFFREELYNQGNEPDIHVPFLFARLGMPQLTGPTVRSLATESITHHYGGNDAYPQPYVGCAFVNQPRGYCPEMDEDDGAMSAWYVFASIGLYPLVVGEAQYELFPPLFDKVTLHLGADYRTTVTISRKGNGATPKAVTWNGKPLKNWRISHHDLLQGGDLLFVF